jgi:hypothetical protein
MFLKAYSHKGNYMAEGLLQGLLKTPQQVREEQLLRMQQQAVAGRQLQSPLRASSALPGIFSNVLAQQAPALATDVAQAARGITQGVGGMLGAVGQQGLGQAVAGATISPEERQAAQAQQALQGLAQNNADSLEAAAQRLQQLNLTGAAQQLSTRAIQLRDRDERAKLARAAEMRAESEEQRRAAGEQRAQAEAERDEEKFRIEREAALNAPKLSSKDIAGLYEKFTGESVEKYVEGRGRLVPLSPEKQKAASAFGNQLIDEGYIPGTPKFEAQMKVYNEKTIDGKGVNRTVKQMNSLEQVDFLNSAIMGDPLYKAAAVRQDKLALADNVLPAAKRNNSQAITTLQRTLSDLFNSDTRAQSEIKRFISDNKSLLQSFNELVSMSVFGEATPEQIANYEEILEVARNATQGQIKQVLEKNISLFEGDLTPEAVKRVQNVYQAEQVSDPLGLFN